MMDEIRDRQLHVENGLLRHHIKAAEAAHHFAESLVETIREPLVVLDAELRVVLANRAFYRTFKVNRTHTELSLFYELGNRQWDIPSLRELLEEILPSNTYFDDFEVAHSFPHIGQRVMLLNARRVLHEDAQTLLILLAIEDVTERRQIEAEHQRFETLVRQTQKMESLGTLSGGIAHEFNNILAGLLGFVQLLHHEIPPDSRAGEYIHRVHQAGLRAKDLVQQITTFSQGEHSAREPLQLDSVVQEALLLLRASLPSTIDIQYHFSEPGMMVHANQSQLHEVVMNLGVNADYAMRENGGLLAISIDPVEVDAIFAATHPPLSPGKHVRVTIGDTGSGIAPEVLARIFEPFFTTKGVGEGTGMGLAIVHGIVTSYGGAITVDSSLRIGTTVAIYLSRVANSVAHRAASELSPPQGLGRVLLVDDEEPVVRATQLLLELAGYDVTAYSTAHEALQTFRKAPQGFDVVITDQTMPYMTGENLAQALRRIRPDIPIIICTGFSHVMDAVKARELGFAAFLMKPVDGDDLASTIQYVLAQHSGWKRDA